MLLNFNLFYTYIMPPADFVDPRIRLNIALEEHIDSLSQSCIQRIRAQLQADNGYICMGGQNVSKVDLPNAYKTCTKPLETIPCQGN